MIDRVSTVGRPRSALPFSGEVARELCWEDSLRWGGDGGQPADHVGCDLLRDPLDPRIVRPPAVIVDHHAHSGALATYQQHAVGVRGLIADSRKLTP